ncbi:MAG: FecR domain-containing protein [Acidobacteria bacterium]|nr:FecR domain-containing protein [Acidobacteriota bacterium]
MSRRQTPADPDHALDSLLAEIRDESLGSAALEQAAARVHRRLALEAERDGASPEVLAGCDDFQMLIPAYLVGELAASRALLLEDHTRSCIPCRRALKAARTDALAAAAPPPAALATPRRSLFALRAAALVLAAVGLGWAAWSLLGLVPLPWGPPTVVAQVDGGVYRMHGGVSEPLHAGDEIPYGATLRSDGAGAAVLTLADGSQVEVGPRAELEVERRRGGTTLRLARGNVIVEAAPQGRGHLFVATDDCLVSVRGTIFAVNRGTKGSRVSVVEGEVEVGYGNRQAVLEAGQQVATHPSIVPVPVAEEISWSRHFDEYVTLLGEIRGLREELRAAMPRHGLRFASRLLDLMPADTLVFVGIPNVGADLDDAYAVLADRVASSPVLARWWQRSFADGDDEMRAGLERIARLSEQLGDEIAVGLRPGPEGETSPRVVLVAEVQDPDALRHVIDDELAGAGDTTPFVVVDDLDQPPANTEDHLLIRVADGLLVVGSRIEDLVAVADAAGGGVNPFTDTVLHQRLGQAYADGVDWLVGADMGRLLAESDGADLTVLDRAGILDVDTLVLERQRDDRDHVRHRATLSFDGPRRGLATWLASPAPMASLDFVSPDAHLVSAALVKDPELMIDDLVDLFPATGGFDLAAQLERLETEHGIDLAEDLAGPLGGEVAFALDGPLLPTPSWKVILEVYDPDHLQTTLERVLGELQRTDPEGNHATLVGERVGGRTYFRLSAPGSPFEVHYTYDDGYLVAAPSRALVERALGYRDSGYTLVRSPRFSSLLPQDGHANFSAISYQNVQPVLGPLAQLWGQGSQTLTEEQRQLLEQLANDAPASLACAYGEEDRIVLVNDSEGDFLSNFLLGATALFDHRETDGPGQGAAGPDA